MGHFSNAVRALKDAFSEFAGYVCRGLSVPERKGIYDLLWGLLKGGELRLSSMARALSEPNTLDSTEVRLSNFVSRFPPGLLDDAIVDRVMAVFSPPYSLCLDESDIAKPQSRKLEDICHVRDASKGGEVIVPGYHLTGLAAVGGQRRTVMFLALDVWSSLSKGFVSANVQTEEVLSRVLGRLGDSTGEISLDRGYDDSATMDFIEKYGYLYTIRARSRRKYLRRGKRDGTDGLASFKGRFVQEFARRDGRMERVASTGFLVSHPDIGHRVMLVGERFSPTDVRFYVTNRTDTRKRGVESAIACYRKRWRIEEAFRFVKQLFGAEGFLVRSLDAMNVLFRVLALASNFVAEVTMRRESLLFLATRKAYPKFRSKEREEEILARHGKYCLDLYQTKCGLQAIMAHAGRRPDVERRVRKKGPIQMTIEECINESVAKH